MLRQHGCVQQQIKLSANLPPFQQKFSQCLTSQTLDRKHMAGEELAKDG
jgi:hypothetical protein